jgi:hypothetical protein
LDVPFNGLSALSADLKVKDETVLTPRKVSEPKSHERNTEFHMTYPTFDRTYQTVDMTYQKFDIHLTIDF